MSESKNSLAFVIEQLSQMYHEGMDDLLRAGEIADNYYNALNDFCKTASGEELFQFYLALVAEVDNAEDDDEPMVLFFKRVKQSRQSDVFSALLEKENTEHADIFRYVD